MSQRDLMLLSKNYHPRTSSPCPCGSALKFGACCLKILSQSFDLDAAIKQVSLIDDHKANLDLRKAAECRYVLWHRKHTVPARDRDPNLFSRLLSTDINAMGELVDGLMDAYGRLDQKRSFRDVLARLEHAIDDERWRQRVLYLRAATLLILEENREAAAQAFNDLENWIESDQVDILQMGIDLCGQSLPEEDLVSIMDRIIALEPSPSNIIQYRTVQAYYQLFGGRTEEAIKTLGQAIDSVHDASLPEAEIRCRDLLASSLVLLAQLTSISGPEAQARLRRARALFEQALKHPSLTPDGKGHLYANLAECYEVEGDLDHAMEHYVLSIDFSKEFKARHGLARIFLAQNSPEKSLLQINNLLTQPLSTNEEYDVFLLMGAIALEQYNADLARVVIARLTRFTSLPVLLEQRKAEILERLANVLQPTTTPRGWKDYISTINRYIYLRPNFVGVGLDVNRMISDAVEPSVPSPSAPRKKRPKDAKRR